MWYCFLKSGFYATIAGVLLAFVIHFHKEDEKNISNWSLHLHRPVAFIIVLLFAFVNTAIPLPANLMASLSSPNSLDIIMGLVVGKLVGIFIVPFLLVKAGFTKLGEGLSWRSHSGKGLLGGIGFTKSMFISNLAYTDAVIISHSKLSILIGSAFSALAGLTVFITGKKPISHGDGRPML